MALEISQMPAPLLFAAAGAAPFIAALALVYASPDKKLRADFWQRAFDLKKLGGVWLPVCLLAAPLLMLLAGGLDSALGGLGLALEDSIFAGALAFASSAVFLFFFGLLPEELGWRGYALDALQERFTPAGSSLLLGLTWALWHLPLSFIAGSYQHSLRAQPLMAILFAVNILSQTCLMTWIFNRTWRSTLSAVLFHYAVNLGGEALSLSLRAEVFLAVLWAAAALGVLLFGRFNHPPAVKEKPA